MLGTISSLQNNLQQHTDTRVENEKLKNIILDLKKQNEAQVKESCTCIQRLEAEMKALQEQHQRELDGFTKETHRKLESKAVEMKEALERKESTLEEIRRKIKDQEKEKQSEIIKLQMEFSARLARAQSMSVKTQQQPQGSGLLAQNIFKRKLQALQEEKNREIEALRQRVKAMEQQSLLGFSESCLKKKRI
ncbi:coiled-coil domain-containing protein 152 [Electrophorus electricus]|uniref:coiled-coil domain-containing protein 152 n=1 Tax=Electrophorus electricus TaxID=8005 RepID=UPI000F0A67D2|nr:coiled-coil domain-containing protein 152 [Electrophorus electricus]